MSLAHRLILAVVCVALAIIFVPALWHHHIRTPEYFTALATIPFEPAPVQVEIGTLKTQSQAGWACDVFAAARAPDGCAREQARAQEGQHDPLAGYVVQVGQFNQAANAAALVVKLRALELAAYTQPRGEAEQAGTQAVLVGPIADKATAQAIQKQIKQQLQVTSFIKAFRP